MASLNLPDPYASIDALVESGDFALAREALRTEEGNLAFVELLEVKIALLDGSLQPQLVMNRLLALMRKDAKIPGLQELYRAAADMSYDRGSSSLSHSHPPPPIAANAAPPGPGKPAKKSEAD
jgi:hypothetical protein